MVLTICKDCFADCKVFCHDLTDRSCPRLTPLLYLCFNYRLNQPEIASVILPLMTATMASRSSQYFAKIQLSVNRNGDDTWNEYSIQEWLFYEHVLAHKTYLFGQVIYLFIYLLWWSVKLKCCIFNHHPIKDQIVDCTKVYHSYFYVTDQKFNK